MNVSTKERTLLVKAGLLVAAMLLAAGCGGSATDEPTAASDDAPITTEEIAQGVGAQGDLEGAPADLTDTADDGTPGSADAERVGPLERGEIDYGARVFEHEQEPDQLDEEMLSSCHHAVGYRSGHAFSICVVSIDGKPVEVHTAIAYHRMAHAAAASGVFLRVVSGFRTMAQQRALYAAYRAGHGNLAAPPGYSNHQSGHALDLNTSRSGVYRWLAFHGRAYGFKRTVASEAWHWEHW